MTPAQYCMVNRLQPDRTSTHPLTGDVLALFDPTPESHRRRICIIDLEGAVTAEYDDHDGSLFYLLLIPFLGGDDGEE